MTEWTYLRVLSDLLGGLAFALGSGIVVMMMYYWKHEPSKVKFFRRAGLIAMVVMFPVGFITSDVVTQALISLALRT